MLALIVAVASAHAFAIDLQEDGSFKLTGFYNLTAAKVMSGIDQQFGLSDWHYQQWHCPCSIQNWEYVGVYEKDKGWQTTPESLVGVQLKKNFSDTFSATAQLVSRGDNTSFRPYTPTVDWAYLSWKPDADSPWTFQAGRKRIPLYYYSDYLYIGYAYPWARPAPDVYGWAIYAYDGANVTYEHELGSSGWSVTANAWYGNFKSKNNPYDTLIYDFTPGTTEGESWKDIWGGYAAVTNGTYELRLMSMQYRDNIWSNNADGTQTTLTDHVFTRITGLAGNIDYKNLLVRSEIDRFQQSANSPAKFVYDYALLGIGYKIGNFTPMYTFSRYRVEPSTAIFVEGRNTSMFSVRWDFMKNTALKVQYDISKDHSEYPYPFFGDSNILSVSLQGIF